ncbi:MAG: DUF1929 domain-containing protein [Myxococcaceae bacterium]|nr:DUF1929 domain-containing protein [Myxococcaceae bacterium]
MGQWSPLLPWPDTGTHSAVLPNGKVLTWTERDLLPFNLWDPLTGARTEVPHPGFNSFCSGHAMLADGRLLVAGGYIKTDVGPKEAGIYDPETGTWTRLPEMNAGRYYPTTTALSNGEMLVIAGTATAQRVGENRLPQVWQPDKNAWRDLTGAQLVMETYPWMFVAPNGKVFKAGTEPETAYLDTSGLGAWMPVATSHYGERSHGSAVMYEPGKVMISGGSEGGEGTPTVEVIDLNASSPAWRIVQPMAQPRQQHNMTLLPDGKVLVTGGSSGPGKNDDGSPVHTPELWDPATETFTKLAPDLQYRGYHSSAVLLPDARVLSVGGQEIMDAQIFSPPYLFRGPRPTITSSPPSVRYGESFTVGTPDAASIAQVTWIRPGSSTHAFNQDQRLNKLGFSREAGGLRVTAPANANLATPGFYLLFLVNTQGVPSVGQWVRVGGPDAQPPEEVPPVPPDQDPQVEERGEEPDVSRTPAARLGEPCDAAAAAGGQRACQSNAACVGTPGVCRVHCTAAADCATSEVCAQLEGHSVCTPEASDGKGGRGKAAGACTAGGSTPAAIGLLLALGWALRRRQLPPSPGRELRPEGP